MLKPQISNCTRPKYVCGNHKVKLIGTTDGLFPDFGHHLEKEMGGLWLYPVKLIDGFWIKVTDHETNGLVDGFMEAGSFENYPHKNVFYYSGSTMGHTPLRITRTQLIPDHVNGLQVSFELFLPESDAGGMERRITFEFLTRINLRPDWLAEELNILDGSKDEIRYDEERRIFIAKDNQNPWYACVGADFVPDDFRIGNEYGCEITSGQGGSVLMKKDLTLKPGEKKVLVCYIAGSVVSEENCLEEYEKFHPAKGQKISFEEEKQDNIEKLLKQTRLDIKDEHFESIFDWIKVHTEWLTLEVEGIGKGITAGIPEYVWWFGCDSCYAIQGMMMQGNFDLCESTIRLLLRFSEKYNGNGKIIHELLPNGHSPNLGNTQETAHFVYLLWEYYQWTGNKELLEKCFPYLTLGVEWLLAQDDDGDCFPTGYGIIEIAGLNMEMIDTAVYTGAAFGCYAKIARVLQKNIDISKWEELAQKSNEAINNLLWDEEEGIYCDCFASAEKIAEKKHMILAQMKEGKDNKAEEAFRKTLEAREKEGDSESGWILNRNWILNVPMEVGIAPVKYAEKALARMHTEEFIGNYGMYLEGLRRQSVMTISTGVMAVAQARYGYSDRALSLIRKMFRSYSMATPGSLSEMSPDYGCFVQAWTAYGAVVPVVKYFFGIQPDAANGVIKIRPCLPEKWKEVSLTNVRVLDGFLDLKIYQEDGRAVCEVNNQTGSELLFEGNFLFRKSSAL